MDSRHTCFYAARMNPDGAVLNHSGQWRVSMLVATQPDKPNRLQAPCDRAAVAVYEQAPSLAIRVGSCMRAIWSAHHQGCCR